jgi:hypothetical protein
MVYHLARLLASSRSVAFLGVLAFCYHAQLANLVFSGSFIYDALCGFFYFAALTYYIHIREKGLLLRPTQCVGFLALYICALNVKEMAVTLPVVILIYELLKYPHELERPRFFRWILYDALPALLLVKDLRQFTFTTKSTGSALPEISPRSSSSTDRSRPGSPRGSLPPSNYIRLFIPGAVLRSRMRTLLANFIT